MQSLTLNQLVSQIRTIGNNHAQINSVNVGSYYEFLSKGLDVVYPSLFIEYNSASINGTTLGVNLSLYVADRQLPEDTNEVDAMSEMIAIAQDLIAELKSSYNDFGLNESIPLQLLSEETADLDIVVQADLQFEIPYLADYCQIPFSEFTPIEVDTISLRSLVKQIQEIGEHHEQVRTVQFGAYKNSLDLDVVYPLMHFDYTSASISGKSLLLDFSIYILDRTIISNELEVLSDTLLIAQDIIAQLKSKYYDVILGNGISIDFLIEENADITGGCLVNVTFELPYTYNRCAVPSGEEQGNFLLWNDGEYYLIDDTSRFIYE